MVRTLYLTGEIGEQTYLNFAKQLAELESASVKPVKLIINSIGGSMYDALAIVGLIRNSQCEIKGYVFGACMSSATIILAACDERFAASSAWFMVHSSKISNKGQLEDRLKEIKQEEVEQAAWCDIMEKRTQITSLHWQALEKCKTYFNANKALEYGLIDYILE